MVIKMKESLWTAEAELPRFPKLRGDVKTDVLIIGGGICGILCARFLHDMGIDYVLAEGDRIARGITKNTTAKITAQHGLIYSKLVRDMGTERAKLYLYANLKAVEEYERLCSLLNCAFERRDSYVYTLRDRQKIENEAKALQCLGYKAYFREKTELPFDILGSLCFKEQGSIDPLRFIAAVVKGLNIFENTFIGEITQNKAISAEGRICAKKIIVTTHFPFINKHGSYFLKLYQHRSYVSAYDRAQKMKSMYVDEDKKGMSFRPCGDLLLIGGGGHRTGKSGGNWTELHSFAKEHYPGAELKYDWAAQDCMSLDGIPYIGRYSKQTPNLFVATGFNKWGFSTSMVAAKILTDMVQEKKNACEELFSPSRGMIKPQLFVNGFEAAVNLLTPTVRRCPHMGCALKWNRAEHTWDCPCHGSRFDKSGKLIDNPSTCNADVKKEL